MQERQQTNKSKRRILKTSAKAKLVGTVLKKMKRLVIFRLRCRNKKCREKLGKGLERDRRIHFWI
jgi:hypothetical protein